MDRRFSKYCNGGWDGSNSSEGECLVIIIILLHGVYTFSKINTRCALSGILFFSRECMKLAILMKFGLITQAGIETSFSSIDLILCNTM